MSASLPSSARSLSREAVALGGFFASGFLALTYEVCWIRKASLAFGAASLALSTVLAVFFGLLALGFVVFRRVLRRGSMG